MQAIIAVLNSLNTSDWVAVSIEPKEDQQKVDIVWTDSGHLKTVCQVKSSINNFDKTPVLNILKELTEANPAAKAYQLVLIGTFTANAKTFFNDFKKQPQTKFETNHQKLFTFIDQIDIQLKTLDVSILDDAIISKVHEFLSARHFVVNHATVKLIAVGLTAQFIRFANDGRNLTKAEFEKNLLEWIEFNYPDQLKTKDTKENRLSLSFYLSGILPFNEKLREVFKLPDIFELAFFKKRLAAMHDVYHTVDKIKLSNNFPIQPEYDNPFRIAPFVSLSSSLTGDFPGFTAFDMESISESAKELLNHDIPKDFFNIGNLKRTNKKAHMLAYFETPHYSGTAEEEEKRRLIDELRFELMELKDLKYCWDQLREYRILPIIVQNQGELMNDAVEVRLNFPETLEFLTIENFPYPEYRDNLKLAAVENGEFEFFFRHYKDSLVKDYELRSDRPVDTSTMVPASLFDDSREYRKSLLKRVLATIFDYEYLHDIEGITAHECKFPALRPGEAMATPSYFFAKSFEPFTIHYKITSNLSAGFNSQLEVL
ncbi:MAG TPA: hypothetical protein VIL78_08305 [Hanamia sp.]